MTDLPDAERRLIAALERIDHSVERAARRMTALASQPAPQTPPRDAPSPSEPAVTPATSPELDALHDRQGATLEAMRVRLAEAHERLAETGREAARLVAANEALAQANRALLAATQAGGPDPDTVRDALQAEVEALQAARAAEIAQMSEILDALDRMLGVTTTPRSHSTGGRAVGARGARADAQPRGADSRSRAGGRPGSAREAEPALRELVVVPDETASGETPMDDALIEADTGSAPGGAEFGAGPDDTQGDR